MKSPVRAAATAGRLLSFVCLLSASAVLVVACGGGSADKASQAAARVNKEEVTVHQINFLLSRQPGLRPEQAENASRQALERLIDQELAVQRAQEQKLDRDPRVVQQIEAARREILASAYLERVGENVQKPSSEEVSAYYSGKPALFKERRIYSLQELQIEAKPDQIEDLRSRLVASKNLTEFVDHLKAKGFRFAGNQAVRAAEQLPLNSLDAIARLKDGESLMSPNAAGVTVLFLVGSRSDPVEEARARPAIEAFLLNQRRADAMQKEVRALRESSKIEYLGKFASTPAASASAAAPSGAAASGAMDASTISKGMGLK